MCLAVVACTSRAADPPPPRNARPAPTAPAKPPADDAYDSDALGALSFPLSEGTPAARDHFKRGLLALHSFWYDEAIRQFEAAIAADPEMNMAYWGAAMSHCRLLWGDDDIDAARQLLARMPNPDRISPYEQAWVLAAVELLTDADVHASRQRFLAAMEALHGQFPDDESATFLALALLSAMRPDDPDALIIRVRAGALALGVFRHNPKHPGAAHYLIHAFDTPELALLALPFARQYAQIAPVAFHARHMPAHIYSRLGMWADAVTSCQAAWDASVVAAQRAHLSADHDDFHSLNWLVEMSFERGRRKDADRALAVFANAVRGGLGHAMRAAYASQISSYMMRTGEWSKVDELLVPLDTPAVEDPATAPAMVDHHAGASGHCAPMSASSPTALLEQQAVLDARARAAAMQHDLGKTQQRLADLDALRQKLRPALAQTEPPGALAALDRAHTRRRAALLARATGNDRALLDVLRASAGDSDQESGGESTPSGFLVHEEIADTLMRLAKPADAATEYALALAHHPGRARSLLGGARAATRLGDLKHARALYRQLLAVWSTAEEGTDGLAEARNAVAAPDER